MPPKRNNPHSPPRPARRGAPSSPPPKVMTWPKAIPALVFAVLFDALRFMFEQFWFFGPAIAAAYCTTKVSGVVGTSIGSTLCGAGATAIGTVGSPAIVAFGVVMAMAVGFSGWLIIGGWLMATNARIFTENTGHSLWFVGSLLISEIPIVGSIPGFTIIIIKMYHAQIKRDNENLAKYKKEQAVQQSQEQNQRNTELEQERTAQLEQSAQQEAVNNEMDEQEQTEQQESENEEVSYEQNISQEDLDNKQQIQDKNADLFGEDALSEFNSRQDHTREEKMKLIRAKEIMEKKSITTNEKSDPVLVAAYTRAMNGQEVYDGTPEKRHGFHFSNEIFIGSFGSNTARL